MYQSASNTPVLAEISAEVMAMDYGAVLDELTGGGKPDGWNESLYAPDFGEAGPRALLAAFWAVEGDEVDGDLVVAIEGDIKHDFDNLEKNIERGHVLPWYPRTMSRFVVEEQLA